MTAHRPRPRGPSGRPTYRTPCPLHDARRRRQAIARLVIGLLFLSLIAFGTAIAIYAASC